MGLVDGLIKRIASRESRELHEFCPRCEANLTRYLIGSVKGVVKCS